METLIALLLIAIAYRVGQLRPNEITRREIRNQVWQAVDVALERDPGAW